VTGTTIWHINTDEPSVIDYNMEFKPQDLYTPTPYRASDHDPVIVSLDLRGVYFLHFPWIAQE
jgi:predicted extracellular nuclease